jgi:lipopolysaccharide/colanic/teichoic acid biosynthesis glycosyltransferase
VAEAVPSVLAPLGRGAPPSEGVALRSSGPRLGHADTTDLRRAVKEAIDRCVGLAVLLVVLPLLLGIVLAVRVGSPGPSLFRQVRVGRDGREFTMLKFRTMVVGAEERQAELDGLNHVDQVLFKVRDDPRVTRVGRILRRCSLDELPQLLHVVHGTMSLVGPRPALPAEVAAYPSPEALRRLEVKPGLTGLWQVSGRADLPWDEAVRLDVHYVDTWSLSRDAVILARTVRAVLGGRGAY